MSSCWPSSRSYSLPRIPSDSGHILGLAGLGLLPSAGLAECRTWGHGQERGPRHSGA